MILGLTASHFPPDPTRPLFKGKRLLFGEESLSRLFLRAGATPLMLPSCTGEEEARRLVEAIDGLVLSGGTDVAPENYGETPLRPEWGGDPYRDAYELRLAAEARRQGKPVLGICRGAQVLNVAYGGSLFQDLETQLPGALRHRDWEIYDRNGHALEILEGGLLARLYRQRSGWVNSVHHQAVRRLGTGLRLEATSPVDGVVEAFVAEAGPFALGVQWHPEFLDGTEGPEAFAAAPLVTEFLAACRP